MADETISDRKDEHLTEALKPEMQGGHANGFDRIHLTHQALPELNLADIDVTARLFGNNFSIPLMIGAMTGGSARGDALNLALAEAAQAANVPLALGSQRAALQGDDIALANARAMRAHAPDCFILGNLGGTQLTAEGGIDKAEGGIDTALRAIEAIEANAMAIHLNPLQEVTQPGGDTDWRSVADAIARLVDKTATQNIPIYVKEVGAGLSVQAIERLYQAGVRHVELAGYGGTNWARIEQARRDRAENASPEAEITAPFLEWGLNTLDTLQNAVEKRSNWPDLQIIASGGLRNGLDSAKALWVGADFTAAAQPFLRAGLDKPHDEAVSEISKQLNIWEKQISLACFLTASNNIAALPAAHGKIL